MKKCTHCGKEIEDSASACPYCSWYQPEVKKSETNPVVANNKEVFKTGALIAILGTLIPTWGELNRIVFSKGCGSALIKNCPYLITFIRSRAWANGGAPQVYIQIFIFYIQIIFYVAIIQLVIYIIFKLLNWRNIEISDTKKWLFYAFELVVALTPFVIMWTATIV